ncbi:hypothetical protein C5167_042094 [Papaver somniferum]|nr:hypothetical protein C5167_042094 [Papaver somniferum]
MDKIICITAIRMRPHRFRFLRQCLTQGGGRVHYWNISVR